MLDLTYADRANAAMEAWRFLAVSLERSIATTGQLWCGGRDGTQNGSAAEARGLDLTLGREEIVHGPSVARKSPIASKEL